MSAKLRTRLRETLLWVGAGLGALCMVWALAIVAFGVTPLVFTSGSMSPTIGAGDLGFATTIQADEIEVGDVVSVVDDKGVRITHRVVQVDPTEDGAVLTLQGDANSIPDQDVYPVTSVERVLFSVPKAGYVVRAVGSQYGMFVGGLLVAGVLVIAFRKGDEDDHEDDADSDSEPDDATNDAPRDAVGSRMRPS